MMDTAYIAKVSKAIRKNGVKQTRGQWVRYDAGGTPVSACAIGQAGINLKVLAGTVARELSHAAENSQFDCPVNNCRFQYSGTLAEVVIHLNDGHHSTFNRIANYLDSIVIKG